MINDDTGICIASTGLQSKMSGVWREVGYKLSYTVVLRCSRRFFLREREREGERERETETETETDRQTDGYRCAERAENKHPLLSGGSIPPLTWRGMWKWHDT